MKNTFYTKLGPNAAIHYNNPGVHLGDLELRNLYNELLRINEESEANIVHPFLTKNLPILEIRKMFSSIVITMIKVGDENVGFLLSPIIEADGITVAHAGLVVIAKNPGSDLLTLSGLGSISVGYRTRGKMFTTNISSTPSIIESFTKLVTNAWPAPNKSLVRPPKEYKKAVKVLYDNYIQKNFMDPDKLELDDKRFVIRSSSNKMGFNTRFHSISRSAAFKYLSFCFVWLDYDKQEDMIQVGLMDWKSYVKVRTILNLFKARAMFRPTKFMQKITQLLKKYSFWSTNRKS